MPHFHKFLQRVHPQHEELAQQVAALQAQTPYLRELFELTHHRNLEKGNDREWHNHERLQQLLRNIVRQSGCSNIAQLADGVLAPALQVLLGEDYLRLYRAYLQQLSQQPYTHGWERRPQRSSQPFPYIDQAAETLYGFFHLRLSGYDTATLLSSPPEEASYYGGSWNDVFCLPSWCTACIALGHEQVIEHLREAMLSDNNHRVLSQWHFRAIFRGGNAELVELAGRLLLAARLQEGLRQAIMESCDEGTPQAFWHIYELVQREGLLRFASVKRALACTTGLGEAAAADRKFEQLLRLIVTYRDDAQALHTALRSSNPVEVFLALWSLGFVDVETALPEAERIVREGDVLQVCATFTYLRATQQSIPSHRLARIALHRYPQEPRILAFVCFVYDAAFNHFGGMRYDDSPRHPLRAFYPSLADAKADFALWAEILPTLQKKQTWENIVCPGDCLWLNQSEVADVLLCLAIAMKDSDILDDMVHFTPYFSWRADRLKRFFRPKQSEKHRSYLFASALTDREATTRDLACEHLRSLDLRPDEILQLEEHLRLKAAGMRMSIIQKLATLPDEELSASVTRLLSDKSADRRLAGLDLLQLLHKKGESHQALCHKLLPLAQSIAKPTAKEKSLIDTLQQIDTPSAAHGSTSAATLTFAQGFGLYDPQEQFDLPLPESEVDLQALWAPFEEKSEDGTLGKDNPIQQLLIQLDDLIEAHKDDEFTDGWGNRVTLGKEIVEKRYDANVSPLERLAFPQLWRDWYEQNLKDNFDRLLQLNVVLLQNNRYKHRTHPQLVERLYEGIARKALRKLLKSLKRPEHIHSIISALYEEYEDHTRFAQIATAMLLRVLPHVTPDNLIKRQQKGAYDSHHSIHFPGSDSDIQWWLCADSLKMAEAQFRAYFSVKYSLDQLRYTYVLQPDEEAHFGGPFIDGTLKAFRLGMIPERAIYRLLLDEQGEALQLILSALHGIRKDYRSRQFQKLHRPEEFEFLRPFLNRVLTILLDLELSRGDTPSEATPFIFSIPRLSGVDTFVRVLSALGKDKFLRLSYNTSRESKRSTQTHLLQVCRPAEGDTAKDLIRLAKEAGIGAERLVEAAMLVPAWLPLVEEATRWKGLTSAAYYFRAHTAAVLEGINYRSEADEDPEVQNERAIIARYTPIDLKDLAIGVFDIEWFRSAYKTLGKSRFEVVYAAAKYVSESNAHGRARKFADAATGVLKAAATLKEIKEKRNKDLLMAYGLIPLGRKGEAEVLARYRYIQQFLKESREFGAQRQASEKQASEIALENLARNGQYGDATRLTWSMETLLVEQMSAHFTPQPLDDLLLCVQVDATGKASLLVEKEGKALKALPTKYKKHALAETLREVVKHLKDQHSRSRLMLEQAMEQATDFRASELSTLTRNPVIWPLMQHLVFLHAGTGHVGFYHEGQLVNTAGEVVLTLEADSTLRIAHAVDLYKSGQWSDYQRWCFEQSVQQPFKQVFRELYVPTPEEAAQTQSQRYAGHQIMPQRAVALLKKRKWLATYEEGLQRTFHKEGIVATIYAMADWFSPSDIEAPTLEYVCFYDRSNYRPLRMDEVPAVLFSEVMRDVDLVVSVAHAGGVDPEASHSTIEMRAAIVQCTLPLFRLTNVEIKGSHAHIQGELARYSVHLGSGVVHQDAGAALHILPVHSQGRGRLFLPFVDEDPKTAEILSKILLLAEDTRIKDPSILSQIRR